MNATTEKTHHAFLERIAAARRAIILADVTGGALRIVIICALMATIAAIVEGVLFMGTETRTLLFWTILVIFGGITVWSVILPLLRLLGIIPFLPVDEIADRVGQQFPRVADHLHNVLQLHRAPLYSPALVDAAYDDVQRETADLDFRSIAPWAPVRTLARATSILLVVLAGGLLFIPGGLLPAAYRLLHPRTSFIAPSSFTIVVEPGDRDVIKGDNVTIMVRVEGEMQHAVTLAVRPDGQLEFDHVTLAADAGGIFTHVLQGIRISTSYYAEARDIRSTEYRLSVAERPVVKLLRLSLTPPSYARLASMVLDDNVGDVSALKGTRVHIAIQSNTPLAQAALTFHDSSRIPLVCRGIQATADFPVRADGSYIIRLRDSAGTPNIDPVEYNIKVIPDRFPAVVIVVPGQNLDVTENQALGLVIKGSDDYGFTRLQLASRLSHSRFEKPATEFTKTNIPLPPQAGTELLLPYNWLLKSLALVPEDIVEYYVELFDNDNVSGPKSAVSETYTLRLPSLDEVFADVDKGHEMGMEDLREALRQSEEAQKDLEELHRGLRKEQDKMDWQEQQQAHQMMQKYEAIQKKLEEVNKSLSETMQKMENHQVLSKETLDKYQELQQLMQELHSPEFSEAMKKLQQAMEQMNPDQMRQALSQFSFSEENFRKGIERTLGLFKRLQIEQKVDEASKRLQELQRREEELQQQTEKTKSAEDAKDLARRQEELRKELAEMKKQLDDLKNRMEEFPTEMPMEEMQQAQQALQDSALESKMSEISQQLGQQEFSAAAAGEKQASQQLGELSQKMDKVKKGLQDRQQRQIVNSLRRAAQDMVALSKKQEELKNRTRSMNPGDPGFRENAQQQMDLVRDLGNITERLSQAAQKSFAISPELGKAVGEGMRSMSEATQSLDQRNGASAGQQQGAAMGSLNEAAQMLQSAINGMMQGAGGQGMGMAGFMMRLRGMTGQQQGINDATRGMQGLGQDQAAAMGRLAAEQAIVRKSLDQLAREAASSGDLSKMLGDLGQVSRDMNDVQKDLTQGNASPETIRKQERIVSRLLDAQRSARERDFEKKRRAETGKNVARTSPGAVDLSTQEGLERFRRDLLKSLEGTFGRDYQELIRKYFEALENSERSPAAGTTEPAR
jgi:hypothetical protein